MSQANADVLSGPVTNGISADGVVDIKSVARLDTDGKTVDQVFQDLCRFVRGTELEPEWLCHANLQDDANEAMYGARHSRPWPEPSSYERISVSVCIGNSEGWLIHVDFVSRPRLSDSLDRTYAIMPLLRAKVFSTDQAWSLARLIARLIDAA
ncbi:hypothetical protein BSFA1_79060 (plasmid) [Burkholderia sp. SFA1]|nr:hypothetical protein BSFA1_79060 [Burkholderia sp. SFA1]